MKLKEIASTQDNGGFAGPGGRISAETAIRVLALVEAAHKACADSRYLEEVSIALGDLEKHGDVSGG